MKNLCTKLFTARGLLALLAMAVFMVGASASVWAAKDNLDDLALDLGAKRTTPPVYITLGKAELLDVEGEIADVLVANPSIVDVMAVQSNRLYVVGLAVGDTNLIALDSNGDVVKRVDVHVKYDFQAIQSLLDEMFPAESPRVSSVHGQIILSGSVSSPDQASKIANVVGHYVSALEDTSDQPIDSLISNLLEVRGEQQVSLQVKIVEASRSVLKELGVETNFNDLDETATTTIFGGSPSISDAGGGNPLDPQNLALSTAIGLSQTPAASARALFDSGVSGIGTIGLFLNALEEQNLVNVLAEPNLTAVSGEQAGFLAGGEFPVPVGRDQVGNIIIEFREFGVSLNFRPVVMSGERISLQMNTEVSSLDFDSAIVLADLTVPGLDIRRADTTVEVPSGGSLMIAGLLKSETVEGMSGLPGISNTPVLGDLVKSDRFQRDETELVVIVTPYLVKPYAQEERATPVPKQHNNPLARAFAKNIRRSYDVDENDDARLFATDERYGYLLD